VADNHELAAARAGDHAAFARVIEPYRRELRAHCYRMAGSLHDADDLLQDSLVRAWRGLASFEGRASLRTWLYKVTTHTCLDKLEKRPPLAYVEPCPPELYEVEASPEAQYERREAVAFALLRALQVLTPKQRAVLILRDVVGMQAAECAALLELSVQAVNSALVRAREAVTERPAAPAPPDATLLARYVRAWESNDTRALIELLREDAELAMPPLPERLVGHAAIAAALDAMVFAGVAPGAMRLVATEANGLPAFANYQDGQPRSVHVLELAGGQIARITAYVDPTLFALFGLPAT